VPGGSCLTCNHSTMRHDRSGEICLDCPENRCGLQRPVSLVISPIGPMSRPVSASTTELVATPLGEGADTPSSISRETR